MRSGAAAGHVGYFHEAAYYAHDDELLDVVLPFLRGGVQAGEPTVVTFGDRNTALVRAALGDTTGVTFLPGADQYARPPATIRAYTELFASLVAAGAEQVRVVGDVPHPGTGAPWEGWARYEAVVNDAFAAFPVWGLCPYDLRTTPEPVLDEVACTHPHLAGAGGTHQRNERFVPPSEYLRARPGAAPDPAERTMPDVVLWDATPVAARQAATTVAAQAGLGVVDGEHLQLALSELVTNGVLHGRAPVTAQLWVRPGRVVATVTDTGSGPDDGAAVLLLPEHPDAVGGRGLWLVHQVCPEVALRSDRTGFTVQIALGAPDTPRPPR